MKCLKLELLSGETNLNELEWNFDHVPDSELVACCFWEYARESAFIRDVRQRCLVIRHSDARREDVLHVDLQKVQSIGHPATYFLHGFFCPPDGVLPDALPLQPGEVRRLTGSFPKPWQLLTKEEREYRCFIPPRGIVDCREIAPFERGDFLDARDIDQTVTAERRLRDDTNAQARRENPGSSDAALARTGKLQFPEIRPSVIHASGTEKTIVQISWGLFTNEEIINAFRKWLKTNRPTDLPGPDNKGRNKSRDWRVALERLAMMRVLHRFRLSKVLMACPKAWRRYGKREWYKERKRASATFHRLFPFVAKSEQPLSWPTEGRRSK